MNITQAIGWAIRGHEETSSTHCVVQYPGGGYIACQGLPEEFTGYTIVYVTI
jgi:hypothetical protein